MLLGKQNDEVFCYNLSGYNVFTLRVCILCAMYIQLPLKYAGPPEKQ